MWFILVVFMKDLITCCARAYCTVNGEIESWPSLVNQSNLFWGREIDCCVGRTCRGPASICGGRESSTCRI